MLGEIADLLEIKGENAFKIRAYRSAADTVATTGDAVARMTDAQLRAIPGIGKDLAARIRELADTGASTYHRTLLEEFPPTMLDLLRLQGVGPKTVARLHATLGVASLDDLAAAARAGRIRTMPGMGAKKEAQILKAVEDRQRDQGRHLLADTAAVCDELLEPSPRRTTPRPSSSAVGSLRRGRETCGDIDILCIGGNGEAVMARLRRPPAGRARARPGRHQVERPAARRLPGRPAPRRAREPRGRDAVLHRLEGAQHRAARPGAAARLPAERIRSLQARRRVARGRRHRRGHLRGARPAVGRARAARTPWRAAGQRAAHAARRS